MISPDHKFSEFVGNLGHLRMGNLGIKDSMQWEDWSTWHHSIYSNVNLLNILKPIFKQESSWRWYRTGVFEPVISVKLISPFDMIPTQTNKDMLQYTSSPTQGFPLPIAIHRFKAPWRSRIDKHRSSGNSRLRSVVDRSFLDAASTV